jgi:UDP-hydrolysing UDP-N-acetyl-D-glucosamine 2-epimerase
MATAISASYLNIPVAHIQGGEMTGSIDEKVRHAVTKLSSLHFVANKHAERRVKMMGENPEYIFVTGCPSIDLACEILKNTIVNFEFYLKYKGIGNPIDLSKDYIVVMQHPDTTEYDYAYDQMWETLMAIYELKIPAMLFWPNMDAGSEKTSKAIRVFRERYSPDFIHFLKNMEPEDFLRLLISSKGIIGNSSVGIRECSFLGVPAVNIGDRQKGRERGWNIIDVGHDRREIMKAVETHFRNGSKYESCQLYGEGNAGKKIADILIKTNPPVKKIFMENFKS